MRSMMTMVAGVLLALVGAESRGAAPAVAAPAVLPAREAMLADLVKGQERFWKMLEKGEPTANMGCRSLFDYALVLCEARQYPERLEKLFDVAAKMQDREATSRSYGNFRWYWSNDRVMDYNAVDFCMQAGGLIWLKHKEWVPAAARAKLKELLELGTQGCLRHKVNENYTNIALMNAQDLIILGEALGDKKAADAGYARLDQQLLYLWECGIHEYDSPTYYGVDLDALGIIEAHAQRERGKQQARALLELFWTDIGANFFWPSLKLGGTRSRDYDYLRGLGVLDHHLWLAGWLPAGALPRANIFALQTTWRPGAAIRAMSQQKFPRLVKQSWGEREEEYKTHWVARDVSLGSSGACYHNMDIPLSVDLPGERTGVRCYLIADGRHDPYGKIKIPEGSGAHQKTLHLKTFVQGAQRTCDAGTLVIYRKNGKDYPEDTQTLETHWVMPREAGDAFWIGERRVDLSSKATLAVKAGEAVVLQRGTATVGIRVMWARACDGGEAKVTLENDGNAFGAVRLSVDHRVQKTKDEGGRMKDEPGKTDARPAGVGVWVRVGSELKDAAGAEAWRKAFGAARGHCDANEKEVDLKVDGVEGRVRVQASAPYVDGGTFDPPPAKVILEIDGVDVGRKILADVEPIKGYRLAQGENALIAVPAASSGKGAYFEAEAGACVPGFAIAEDATASGGKYVWLPGEAGGRGGGYGSVTWRLKLEEAGAYYVWGRVLSPTPDDDSFNVRVLSGREEIMATTAWPLGVHKEWTWVRFNPGEGKEIRPVYLIDGEVKLQLRPREDGAKIDRWFVTGKKEETPGK